MKLSNNNSKNSWLTDRNVTVFVVITVVAVVSVYFFSFRNFNISKLTSDWGSFGDYFSGMLNGILAPVTVYLLWKTYSSQKEELAKQQGLIDSQTRVMQKQVFEQTFFTWHNNYVQEYSMLATGKNRDETLQKIAEYPYHNLSEQEGYGKTKIGTTRVEAILKKNCARLFNFGLTNNYENVAGLIRSLLGLISWVDESEIPQDEKNHYMDIIGCRLSNYEIRLIFFAHLSALPEFSEIATYVKKYKLFDVSQDHVKMILGKYSFVVLASQGPLHFDGHYFIDQLDSVIIYENSTKEVETGIFHQVIDFMAADRKLMEQDGK